MSTKPKILLIEDDPAQTMMYTTKFTISGFEVKTLALGSQAVQVAKEFKPDIILCDVHMYDTPGQEVLKALKADSDTKNFMVLMLTNMTKQDIAEECLKLGAKEYLIKTALMPSEIVAHIHAALESKKD